MEEGLLDTNLLVYADNADAQDHLAARAFRNQALNGEVRCCVAWQNLSEYYAVMTGKKREKPLRPADAWANVRTFLDSEKVRVITPRDSTWQIVEHLLKAKPVAGVVIHDLTLAATALSHGVRLIYTANLSDFKDLPGIRAVNPLVTEKSN